MKIINRIFCFCLLPGVLAVAISLPARAQEASVDFSPDITLNLDGVVTADEDVSRDDFANVFDIPVGAIPPNADITVYHMLANGDALLSFDITIELPGAVIARPQDVVRYDGVNYSIELDGLSEGIPAGVGIDAASIAGDGDLLLSIDGTVDFGGLVATDEDIIQFDGNDFSLAFDGSTTGIATALDIDAMHFAPDSNEFYFSFDTGGEIENQVFSDEDLLKYNPESDNWSMAYDGSTRHPEWVAGDMDAAFVSFLVGYIFRDGFENF